MIPATDREKWNSIVKEFTNWDIYYTWEYAVSFTNQDGGKTYLIHYTDGEYSLYYVVIERDIADIAEFTGRIPAGKFFDWETPYGYGGPFSADSYIRQELQKKFLSELTKLARKRNVVSQFIRFHPLLGNHLLCDKAIEYKYIHDVIYMDLCTEDDILVQIHSKARNLVRKAIKNNIIITHDKGQHLDEFISIYEATMQRDDAGEFYYFPREYYEFLCREMGDNIEFFYASKDDKIIAAAIFFYGRQYMHYHLSGSLKEYGTYAPNNLLIYEAAKWGRERGCEKLHLGGGIQANDGLFHFKQQFNPSGRIGFFVGRNIFLPNAYKALLQVRKDVDNSFDMDNGFMIQYRR